MFARVPNIHGRVRKRKQLDKTEPATNGMYSSSPYLKKKKKMCGAFAHGIWFCFGNFTF